MKNISVVVANGRKKKESRYIVYKDSSLFRFFKARLLSLHEELSELLPEDDEAIAAFLAAS